MSDTAELRCERCGKGESDDRPFNRVHFDRGLGLNICNLCWVHTAPPFANPNRRPDAR